jgi:ABC-type uncharacterized transport system permease subunit
VPPAEACQAGFFRLAVGSTVLAHMLLDLLALLALVPAVLLLLRPQERRDAVVWCALALAVAGPTIQVAAANAQGWHASFGSALWVSADAALILFVVAAALNEAAWRLLPLLAAYCFLLGVGGTLFSTLPPEPQSRAASAAWLDIHIAVSLATYGLATIAAVAGLAGLLQERALKRRRQSRFLQTLPSIADGERLVHGLLGAAEVVLGIGVLSGMATQYLMSGRLLVFDHKTVFSLLAFVVIGLLLWLQWRTGLRGRRAARFVLTAYLLLTLAFLGVKFVRDVLLS